MLLVHLGVGFVCAVISVLYSLHAGFPFLVGLALYSVVGSVGTVLSAAISYGRSRKDDRTASDRWIEVSEDAAPSFRSDRGRKSTSIQRREHHSKIPRAVRDRSVVNKPGRTSQPLSKW